MQQVDAGRITEVEANPLSEAELTVADALPKRLDMKAGLKSIKSEISLTNCVIKHCASLCAMGLYKVATDDIQEFTAGWSPDEIRNQLRRCELRLLLHHHLRLDA